MITSAVSKNPPKGLHTEDQMDMSLTVTAMKIEKDEVYNIEVDTAANRKITFEEDYIPGSITADIFNVH